MKRCRVQTKLNGYSVPVCGKAEVFSSDPLEFWHKQASFTGIIYRVFVSIKCLMEDSEDLGDKYRKTEPTRYFIVGIRYFSVL